MVAKRQTIKRPLTFKTYFLTFMRAHTVSGATRPRCHRASWYSGQYASGWHCKSSIELTKPYTKDRQLARPYNVPEMERYLNLNKLHPITPSLPLVHSSSKKREAFVVLIECNTTPVASPIRRWEWKAHICNNNVSSIRVKSDDRCANKAQWERSLRKNSVKNLGELGFVLFISGVSERPLKTASCEKLLIKITRAKALHWAFPTLHTSLTSGAFPPRTSVEELSTTFLLVEAGTNVITPSTYPRVLIPAREDIPEYEGHCSCATLIRLSAPRYNSSGQYNSSFTHSLVHMFIHLV